MATSMSDARSDGSNFYLFELDYGSRDEARAFIKAALNAFDNQTLVGAGIFVNNNPYSLETYFFANLEKDHVRFERWLADSFPKHRRL
jgi:hypothetical protein